MAQDRIKINGIEIWQPDSKELGYSFETTYSEDSARTQDGVGHFTPLFTVEQLSYSASNIPAYKASEILQNIAKGGNFTLHYYSLYYNEWRDGTFYVGKGNLDINSLVLNDETVEKLSFNMTGVDPI